MVTFSDWLRSAGILHRLWLIETYFTFDPAQYNQLFDDELRKLQVSDPRHREAIERMFGFNWIGYIAKSLRNAGYRGGREVQERTHDLVVKMLTGGLFRDYDELRHGPLDLRFKRAVANAVKNMIEKDRNRQLSIPTVSIAQKFQPGDVTADELPGRAPRDDDEAVIDRFRALVRKRLGEMAVGILDAFLGGVERNALVGNPDLGRPGKVCHQESRSTHQGPGTRVCRRPWRSWFSTRRSAGDGERGSHDPKTADHNFGPPRPLGVFP